MKWIAGQEQTVVQGVADGLSAQEIADRLPGVSRGAVIGKISRLGLKLHRPHGCHSAQGAKPKPKKEDCTFGAKPSPRRTRAPGDQPPSPSPQGLDHSQPRDITPLASDPPEHERVDLLDLKHGQCKWGIGYPAMFCGRPTCARGSGSYCTDHAARAFAGTGSPKKKWADDDPRRAAFAARARQTFNVREDAL